VKKASFYVCILLLIALLLGCTPVLAPETQTATDENQALSTAPETPSFDTQATPSPENTQQQSPQPDLNGLQLAFIPKSLNDPYYVAIGRALEDGAQEYGVILHTMAPAISDAADQQSLMLRTVIQSGVDGIILVPVDFETLKPVCMEAMQASIPVFLIDEALLDTQYGVGCVRSDEHTGLRRLAEWMGEEQNGKGTVGILADSSAQHTARRDGFASALTETHPEIEPVGFFEEQSAANASQPDPDSEATPGIPGEDTRDTQSLCAQFIEAFPDVDSVFACSDALALEYLSQLKAAGKERPVVCSFGGSPEAAQAILDGELQAAVAVQPAKLGSAAFALFAEYVQTGGISTRDMVIETLLTTEENCEACLQYL
jgi:ribose transport system substrate-binding protein